MFKNGKESCVVKFEEGGISLRTRLYAWNFISLQNRIGLPLHLYLNLEV